MGSQMSEQKTNSLCCDELPSRTWEDGCKIEQLLRDHGMTPTNQRMEIGRVIFSKPMHFTAEELHRITGNHGFQVSIATVYNTLGRFLKHGLVREVIVEPGKVYYDSTTTPHHHYYDVETGMLHDIDSADLRVSGLYNLPPGKEIESVEVVVRLRSKQ